MNPREYIADHYPAFPVPCGHGKLHNRRILPENLLHLILYQQQVAHPPFYRRVYNIYHRIRR
jgi:hypothetical protein